MAKPKVAKKAPAKEAPANSKNSGKNTKPDENNKDSQPQEKKGRRPPMNPEARRAVTNSVSWTGKLPATLLHEHCQKQKWEKLQFDMRGGPDKGFVATAVLANKNVKTGQIETVRFIPPSEIFSPQKTPLEARHVAATYGLHRVASHRNMKPMLPPDHRTYWSKLDDLKKQHLAESPSANAGKKNAPTPTPGKEDKAYMYAEDPFQAERERKTHQEKRREIQSSDEHKKKMEMRNIMNSVKTALSTEQQTRPSSSSSSVAHSTTNSGENTPKPSDSTNTGGQEEQKVTPSTMRYNRPKFDKWIYMSRESRSKAEEIIKKYHGFASGNKVDISDWNSTDERYKTIVFALLQMGFSRYQAEESLEYCITLSDAIEWLLIHVPEDDLPSIFAASPEKMDNRGTTIVTDDLKFEYAVRDIRSHGGYSEELIRDHMRAAKGDKRRAIVNLTHSLLAVGSSISESEDAVESAQAIWDEEIESLESIFDSSEFVNNKDQRTCTFKYEITVKLDDNKEYDMNPTGVTNFKPRKKGSAKATYKVEITFWMPDNYPNSIPGVTIEAQSNVKDKSRLPMFSLLDLIKRTCSHVQENALGDFMISTMADWFKDNFEEVLTHPSKLVKLASGITGVEEDIKPSQSAIKNKKGRSQKTRDAPMGNSRDPLKMKDEHAKKLASSSNLKSMIDSRKTLPAWKKQQEIVDLVQNNQVVLITGETGSGKSTQVAQFLIDSLIEAGKGNKLNIICSQPRRISAMGLAQRVADERDSPVGQDVGYVIRGESKTTNQTLLRFVTTGVLLRMIQSASVVSSDNDSLQGVPLQSISHVIVDEVHERSLDSDFLLILLKRIASVRKDLKIILMSATVDPALFINYFGGKSNVGYTHIEGRTFPVQDYYLDKIVEMTGYTPASLTSNSRNNKADNYDDYYDDDDYAPSTPKQVGIGQKILAIAKQGIPYDLIANLVAFIDRQLGEKEGAILVFMPGTAEIDRCLNTIKSSSTGYRYYALPLHASLAPSEQRKIFPKAPKGVRKVVVSTNVAETSITIPDIVAVIDTGRVKETKYDVNSNVTRLVDSWTSKAAATQRRGRAGRVREGDCYKLFTKAIEEKDMPTRPLPEILRVPLEQLYLSVKSMGIKVPTKFLHEAIDPPHITAIERARNTLVQLGALELDNTHSNVEEVLTPLGTHMSMIPADLRVAKLLVLSAMFGCIYTGLVISAILSLKSPFVSISDKREEIRQSIVQFSGPGATRKKGSVGDLLSQAKAYYEWENRRNDNSITPSALRRWCKDNYLSYQTLQDIQSAKRQFISTLQEIGFVPAGSVQKIPEYYTINDDLETLKQTGVIRAVIGASMGPTNLAKIVLPEKTFKNVGGAGAIEVELSDSKAVRYFGPNTNELHDKDARPFTGSNSSNNNEPQRPQLTERFFVHPASSLFEMTKFLDDTLSIDGHLTGYGDGAYVSFSRKMYTSKLFIDGLTPLNTYGLVFFADNLKVDVFGNGVVVGTGGVKSDSQKEDGALNETDDWLGLKCWPRIGILVKLLRHLFNDLMKQKLKDPGMDFSKNEIILFIEKMIETNGSIRK